MRLLDGFWILVAQMKRKDAYVTNKRKNGCFHCQKNIYIWQNIKRYHLDVGANWVVAQYPGRFEVMPLNVLPNI